MARVYVFLTIALAITVMMFLAGLTTDSSSFSSTLMNQIFNNNVTGSDLWTAILIAVAAVTVGATVAALFGNANSAITIANAGLVTAYLVSVVSDYIFVLNQAKISCGIGGTVLCGDWVYYILSAIFIPIIGGLIFSLWEFITGNE